MLRGPSTHSILTTSDVEILPSYPSFHFGSGKLIESRSSTVMLANRGSGLSAASDVSLMISSSRVVSRSGWPDGRSTPPGGGAAPLAIACAVRSLSSMSAPARPVVKLLVADHMQWRRVGSSRYGPSAYFSQTILPS